MFTTSLTVEWGDCDEAGIVFYPNVFYWCDCTFQRFLRARKLSQRVLRARFGAVTPLTDVGARFLKPCRYDDELAVTAEVERWDSRRFRLRYTFRLGADTAILAHEERAWVTISEDGVLRSKEIDAEFRDLLSHA